MVSSCGRSCDEALKYFYKLRSGGLQFLQVVEGKCFEELFAIMGELDEDLPAIIGCPQAGKKASVDQPIDQLNGAVMLELHAFRQNPNSRLEPAGETSYRQEELVLLRLDTGFSSGLFAETQEAADLVA